MVKSRFRLKEENDTIELVDNDNILKLQYQFSLSDKEWLSVLKDFLNKQDIILHDVIMEYSESVDELNNFRAKIIHTLQEEILDCEQLIIVGEDDPYTEGRLVELHNIMKVLL